MARTATRILTVLAAAMVAADLISSTARGEAGLAGGEFHFSATVGGGKVLLRWTPTERPSPYAAYILMKKVSITSEFNAVGSILEPLTDPNTIDAVFAPGSEIRNEVSALLVGEGKVGPDLPSALLALRSSTDPTRRIQREMLLNTNYGVSIVEGLAYLDPDVTPEALYTYEIWSADPNTDPTEPVERLGKLTVKVHDTMLPPPTALSAVTVPGEVGNGKVFLYWDPTPDPRKNRETTPTGFGFDVYRLAGGVDPNAVIPDPALPIDDPNSGAIKINTEPVIPVPTTDPNSPNFFFVDGHPSMDPNLALPGLTTGTSYKYWLVARDLLRRHGTFSAPLQVCVPDQRRPRQVTGVTTRALIGATPGIEVSWKANADDPNGIGVIDPYVDDTASYSVYRADEPEVLLGTPDPLLRIVEGIAGTTFFDSVPAQAGNQGQNFWYAVSAVDPPLCNKPANESHYSAPTRGIYYDVTAPTIADVDAYCDSAQNPRCIRDCGPSSDPNYLLYIKPWCDCGGASGIWPLTGDTWGYKVSNADVPPDTRSLRLYRGSKGKAFKPVEETLLNPSTLEARLPESFGARISQKIEYRVRSMDRDSNLGPSMEALGAESQQMPAFVKGGPPLAPVILSTAFDPLAASLTIRWHAPGAGALAGFVLRLGPEADVNAGTFKYLPGGNLFSETSLDPNQLLPGDPCDPDHDGKADIDGNGLSPYAILITDATEDLAGLTAVNPPLGGLRDPATGYFQYTFSPAVLALDTTFEVRSVDIAGQISAPAVVSRLGHDVDPDTLPWPDRSLPPSYRVAAVREDVNGLVNVCWDQNQAGIPAEIPAAGNPRWVAVFRSLVEASGARGYQQRSPLVDIGAYTYTLGDPAACSTCRMHLEALLAPNPISNFVCWKDFDISPVATYRYSVVGFRGAPGAPGEPRDEREIQAVFAAAECPPGVAICAP